MISKEEIKKLADLARIEIKEEELEDLRGEIDSILEYVGQVSHFAEASRDKERTDEIEIGENFNVMREDESESFPMNESGTYTDALLAEAPETQDSYIKVKKIL